MTTAGKPADAGAEQSSTPPPRTPKARASRTTPARKATPSKATEPKAAATAPDATPEGPSASTPPPAGTVPASRAATPTKRAPSARKSATPKKAVPAPAPEPPTEQAPADATAPAALAEPASPPAPTQPVAPNGPTQAEQTQQTEQAQQAQQAQQSQQSQQSQQAEGTEQAGPPAAARTPESELRAVTARLLDHPGFAPELLALAAVRALGPTAGDWAERLRGRYPDAPADGLARLANRRFVRSAGVGGAAAALAGLFAPLAELVSVLWTQANLVLHLAAAYGRDPAHPDRAVELLVLTQVHPDEASARTALDAARAVDGPGDEPWLRVTEATWRLAAPLAAQAGGWLALRLASRLLPGAAVLAAALGDAAATDRLAARAMTAYRPARGRSVTVDEHGQSQLNQSLGSSA